MTSSTTAAARTVTPSEESNCFRSLSTLAVMPTEVAVITAPTNNAEYINWSPARPPGLKKKVAPTPNMKGTSTPPIATPEAGPAYLKNCFKSVSNPAANNNTIAAIWDTANNSWDRGNPPSECVLSSNKGCSPNADNPPKA